MIFGQHHTNFIEQKLYDTLPFSPEELRILMETDVIYRTKEGRYIFQIVGAAVMDKRVIYVLPKFESEFDKNAKTGVFYVQAIRRYLLSGSRRPTTFPTLDNIPLIMRTFEELNSFYNQFGIYKERRNVHIASESRQTNWIKTINKNQAMFSSVPDYTSPLQSVLYTNPMISTHSSYEGEVSYLFRTVLTLLSTFISPIIRISHPLEVKTAIDKIVDSVTEIFNKSVYFRRILRAHIAAEAGSRKRILKALYNFLSSDNESLAKIFSKKIFVFGTQNFEFVWEDACLTVLAAHRGSKDLAQPRISTNNVRIGQQRTDGIIYPFDGNNRTSIIDAKYYIPYREKPITLPVGDVMKQFGYAISARASWPRCSIQSFMLFPDLVDSNDSDKFLGIVDLEKEKITVRDLDPIILVKIKPSEVFNFYVKNCLNEELRKSICGDSGIVSKIGLKNVFSAVLNGETAEITVDKNDVITLKAGSIFKCKQTTINKSLNVVTDSNLPRAKALLKRMLDKKILVKRIHKGRSDLRRLSEDFICESMAIATLIISDLDANVPSDIWVERGTRIDPVNYIPDLMTA